MRVVLSGWTGLRLTEKRKMTKKGGKNVMV